jgi:hypothetical protein
VKISQPAVEHRVRIKDFTNWLDSAGKSPAEDGFEDSAAGYRVELSRGGLSVRTSLSKEWKLRQKIPNVES